MRVKKVTRYYCDFCSRGHFQKPSAEKHESGCTSNPNRVCRLCERAGNDAKPLPELIAILEEDCGEAGVEKLKEAVKGCPLCMLAAIKQSKIQDPDDGSRVWITFDYKDAHAKWWKNQNEVEIYDQTYRGGFC